MHTEPSAGDIHLDLDITTFPYRLQHRNQDNFHSMKMLFDEMKFFHLDVASLAPCAMGAVERDYDQAQFLPWSRGAVSLLSPVRTSYSYP